MVDGMTRSPTTRLLHETVHFLLGLIALTVLTASCFWLDVGLVSTAFTYLILILLLSLAGGFIPLIALSFIAVASLNYFFAPPIFSLHVEYLEDIITVTAFLITSLMVTGLVRRTRVARDELAHVVDGIPALVWNMSSDGAGEFFNQRFLEYTGFSAEDMRGWGWTNALHPQDRGLEEWRAALAAGEPLEKETRLLSSTGEYRWFVLRVTPLRNERGIILKWYATGSDVEDRKRALEAVRDSEEKWRAVFEHNPTMYFMVDAAGIVLSVNPFGANQLGYSVDELVGRSVLDVFYEADRAAVQRNAAICLERLGQPMTWETRKVRKDGTMLWVRETGKAMVMKERPVILIVCEDITDRKRAEYLTEQVFESLPDLVSLIGRDYRYRRANPSYERIWGIAIERIIGMHAADVIGRKKFDRLAKPNLDRCFAGEEISYADWFDTPGGRKYWLVTYSPLRLDSEQVDGALVVARDLTDQMLAADKLRDAQIQLTHANRVATIGQLTASIAHEVKQPITALVTNAHAALRMLGTQPPDPDQAYQALDDIIKNGRRVSDVIDRIRALVKKTPPKADRLDINEVITDSIALTRGEILRNGISLETQVATNLPPVQGDRVQLQQVIMNLVINAVEAISALHEGARDLQIATGKDPEDCIVITVRDSGPVLKSKDLDRFFEAFYSTKPNGMGMGLSICRSIVEAHGGQIWATANAPQGATLHITLPASQEAA
jgi:PAS domain S-box-containing protein